jgi:hypothetical protein
LRNGDSTTLFQFANTTGRRQQEEIAKRCVSIHLVWLVVILRACVLSFLSAARQTFELNLVMHQHDDGGWCRAAEIPHSLQRMARINAKTRERALSLLLAQKETHTSTRDNMKLSTLDNNLFVKPSATASNLSHFYRERGKPPPFFGHERSQEEGNMTDGLAFSTPRVASRRRPTSFPAGLVQRNIQKY